MVAPRHARATCIAAALAVLVVSGVQRAPANPGGGREATGRFLYAGDDDWDWASPLNAEKPCKLARFGVMPWSALDWIEQDLPEVRGILVGTPPNTKVGGMSLEELSAIRGEQASYRHEPQAKGVIAKVLAAKDRPNVIILMQNQGKEGELDDESVTSLVRFVKEGGRLLVLDDWKHYHPVLDTFLGEALQLPPGPPLPDDPVPRVRPAKPAAPAKPAPVPEPSDEELETRVEELLPLLGDEDFDTRERATASLRKMGARVLPLIREARADDPEVAHRLEKLRKALAPGRGKKGANPAAQGSSDQRRAEKHKIQARITKMAAAKLRAAKIPHHLRDVSVDKEGRALPALRIAFPIAE